VLNVADIGQIPSVRILDSLLPGAAQNATFLTQAFNTGLGAVLAAIAALPDVEIAQLDIFLTVHEIVADPAAFGLTDAVHACITPNLPPFTCKTPDEFLFWDGIHPTKVVHAIFAEEAAEILEK
jgi:phospholipase/lecithinase/hemolysin